MADAKGHQGRSLLVVDDDVDVAQLLAEHLTREGFDVATAPTIGAMWKQLERDWPDVVLLDVNLPDGNGTHLVPALRAAGDLGIVMLTVQDDPEDRSEALDVGADDYVGKPFALREVTSRVRALLRRLQPGRALSSETGHVFGGWTLEEERGELVHADGRVEALTAKEARLWQALAAAAGSPVGRDTLSEQVRNVAWDPMVRAIDVLIARLRARIEANPKHPRIIITVRNEGYMLVPDESR